MITKESIRKHNLFDNRLTLRHKFMHLFINDKGKHPNIYLSPAWQKQKIKFMLEIHI